jgi:hypothetical protein
MVKVGEKYVMNNDQLSEILASNNTSTIKDRARLIFCPQGESGCGLLTIM